MAVRKKYWWIIIVICILCGASLVLELGTSLIRGYGFVGAIGRMSMPYDKPMIDLRSVIHYCDDHYVVQLDKVSPSEEIRRPEAKEIAANVEAVRLATDQPYRTYGIWLFQSTSHNCQYLYTPLSTKEHDVYWNDPNYEGLVIMCTLAKWEGPQGVYHPYRKFPKFVRDHIEAELGGEMWTCWISAPGLGPIRTDLPPVPGAIIFTEHSQKISGGPLKCRYEKKILPVVKTIYPNLEIPPEAILE